MMRHLRRHFANYVNNFWPLRYLLRKRVRLWPRRPWASSTLTCGLCRQHTALSRLSTSTTAQRSAAQRSTACAPRRDLRPPTRSTPSALGPFGPDGLRPFGPLSGCIIDSDEIYAFGPFGPFGIRPFRPLRPLFDICSVWPMFYV
jgi:hypothetical protein